MVRKNSPAHAEETELEAWISQGAGHPTDLNFQLMMDEIVTQIQETCPIIRQSASLRKIAARFGDAYFFYNQTGEFCLLTD